MFTFGKKLSPEEQAKKWKRGLNREVRQLDRQLRSIETEEKKLHREIKTLAKKGEKGSVKILAKELVRSRKAKEKIHQGKAQLNSVSMQLQQNMAQMKIAGCMQKSAVVMKSMNELLKMPEMMKTMREMAMEMERAGLIEEMMDDAMESLDGEDIEDEVNEQVDQVVTEITAGIMNGASSAPTTALPTPQVQEAEEEHVAPTAEDESNMKDMTARLEAL